MRKCEITKNKNIKETITQIANSIQSYDKDAILDEIICHLSNYESLSMELLCNLLSLFENELFSHGICEVL